MQTAARVDISQPNNATWQDAFIFGPSGIPWPASCGQPPNEVQPWPNYWPYTWPVVWATGATGQVCTPWGCATGPTGTWNFVNQNFVATIKANRGASGPLLTVTSAAGQIVVDDPVNRVLHFNVPDAYLTGATGLTGQGMVPGEYDWEMQMFDNSSPPIRVTLMQGKFRLTEGLGGG